MSYHWHCDCVQSWIIIFSALIRLWVHDLFQTCGWVNDLRAFVVAYQNSSSFAKQLLNFILAKAKIRPLVLNARHFTSRVWAFIAIPIQPFSWLCDVIIGRGFWKQKCCAVDDLSVVKGELQLSLYTQKKYNTYKGAVERIFFLSIWF